MPKPKRVPAFIVQSIPANAGVAQFSEQGVAVYGWLDNEAGLARRLVR